jgi:uncharacterized DUF497 family protein
VTYELDAKKAKGNRRKHRVSSEDAATVSMKKALAKGTVTRLDRKRRIGARTFAAVGDDVRYFPKDDRWVVFGRVLNALDAAVREAAARRRQTPKQLDIATWVLARIAHRASPTYR